MNFLLGNMLRSVWHAANTVLGRVEGALVKEAQPDQACRFVFIVGPPRSGSTLLYQLLAAHFPFFYFTNLNDIFYGCPLLISYFTRRLLAKKSKPSYSSSYGRSKGVLSPSECGEFWYRFFPRIPQAVSLDSADQDLMKKMTSVLNCLSYSCGKPVLIKNLVNSVRLAPLIQMLPGAVFIVTHRDLERNAYSILRSRKHLYGDYSKWFSVQPVDVDSLKMLAPAEQAVRQICSIQDNISKVRSLNNNETRFCDVYYEELCSSPDAVLQSIKEFLKQNGIEVDYSPVKVGSFIQPRTQTDDNELLQEVSRTVSKIVERNALNG